jgi:hypothetical protein
MITPIKTLVSAKKNELNSQYMECCIATLDALRKK